MRDGLDWEIRQVVLAFPLALAPYVGDLFNCGFGNTFRGLVLRLVEEIQLRLTGRCPFARMGKFLLLREAILLLVIF
jgi:hypothetical protein